MEGATSTSPPTGGRTNLTSEHEPTSKEGDGEVTMGGERVDDCRCGRPNGRCKCGLPNSDLDRPFPEYVYALGQISARFPNAGLEKEFAQVAGRANVAGQTDKQALQSILSEGDNRYLVRQMCWVLAVEGLETYLLQPRDALDFGSLAQALRPTPGRADLDIVVGVRGPIAPPEYCNGLMLPLVAFDKIYSFDTDSLIKSIPRPENVPAKEFSVAAEEVFWRIMQITDNAGSTDDHRALNYLAVRYPAIYAIAAEAFGRNSSLSAIEVRASRLSRVRRIVDVIFSYTSRTTDFNERHFVRVDVTDEFPFLVSKMAPYFDR